MAQSRNNNVKGNSEPIRLRALPAPANDQITCTSDRAAAAALSELEALHCEVMSVMSDVVLITDDAGRLTYVSPNVHFIFGHTTEEVLSHGRISFLLPAELFDPDLLEQRGEIANIECEVRDAIGRDRNLLVTVRKVESGAGTVLYVCRDVTERIKVELDHKLLSVTVEKRIEERTQGLRESRDRYKRLVEGVRDSYLFYATDPKGIVTYVSPSVYSILGYTPDQMIGHNWREFVDPNEPSYMEIERHERMRFAGMPVQLLHAAVLHANGETRYFEFRDAPVYDGDGRVISNEGIGKDVTQRHRAEEALRRAHEQLEARVEARTAELRAANEKLRDSEHRYRSVVEDHLEFIVRWRDEGVLSFANQSYCNYCNASSDELKGTSFISTIVEEDREVLKKKLAAVSLLSPVVVHEHRVRLADGQIAWHHWSHRALFNQAGALTEFQSVGRDVTDRRRREENLRDRAVAIAQLRALTERERDVMRLVVAGNANKVIARKLALSIKTIEKHRSSLMKKLHIRSVPELVRLALLAEGSGEVN